MEEILFTLGTLPHIVRLESFAANCIKKCFTKTFPKGGLETISYIVLKVLEVLSNII